jgi:integrase
LAIYALAESESSERAATVETFGLCTGDASMSLVAFIQNKFIPDHVRLKSTAGRVHYQAILKHIIRPETVQTHFAEYPLKTKARLKTVPGWPYLDDVRLCDLEADHIRQLTTSAVARGYSAQTVKHIKNVLSTIISHAQKERLYDGYNPAAEVRLPRLVHTTPRDLTIDEAKSILRLLKYPEREIALISMSTGMGASDICTLRWKHINMTRSEVCIEGEPVPRHGMVFRSHSTGFDGVEMNQSRLRVIVIGDSLIVELERLKRQQEHADPNGFVIATPQGDPIQPMSARTHGLRIIGRKLQLPWLSWRALKRAHGAMLSELSIQLTDDLVRIAQSIKIP